MSIALASGVHLSVLPTTQFKTVRIELHFLAPLDVSTFSARTLLTSMLETSTAAYPTQIALSAELERLFGASFGIGVAKEGQWHRVTATLTLVNDQFSGEGTLAAGFALLNEVLNHPLITAGQFDQAVLARERENLALYLESMAEDRQLQASLATQALYFGGDSGQGVPSFGTPEGARAVDNAALLAAYQQLLTRDQIELVVLGDVAPAQVEALASTLALAPRPELSVPFVVDTPLRDTVQAQTEQAPVNQAKLNLAYHVAAPTSGTAFYAAMVAEELFGGSPLSFLFTNVREKASLAYYASSSLDPYRHFMMVQTGIDTADRERVEALIATQLTAVQHGDFSDDLLANIKAGLLSARLAAYDTPRFLARQALLDRLASGHHSDFVAFKAGIAAVDRAQVQEAAAGMTLQSRYFMGGEELS
ncbi:EF-P 5-aminopentanol modification-associated protein YfmF [Lacticaseibacillus mingshuiensis]|uniref:EF-P 5-aminopentanol modification-associated protein YfmF n=1 Tax=Lacticaseibacillus mingshuiensis TaxID=2799574 RepID=A0ABW4CGX5_9LACO|nr:insulinase family protein [Lacticaseibacillus mingshuiensis]